MWKFVSERVGSYFPFPRRFFVQIPKLSIPSTTFSTIGVTKQSDVHAHRIVISRTPNSRVRGVSWPGGPWRKRCPPNIHPDPPWTKQAGTGGVKVTVLIRQTGERCISSKRLACEPRSVCRCLRGGSRLFAEGRRNSISVIGEQIKGSLRAIDFIWKLIFPSVKWLWHHRL